MGPSEPQREARVDVPGRRRAVPAVLMALAVLGAAAVFLGGCGGAGQPEVVRFTVSVSGDLLIRGPIWRRARSIGNGGYDFGPLFAGVRPYVADADIAICHVEFPLRDRPPHGFPIFSTPVELAGAIRATGWDACDTASNHSVDRGQAGIDSTGRALRRAGVAHTGSFPSAAARARPLILRVKGVKVALLAYTRHTNGIPLPHRWSVNLARGQRIVTDVRRARARGAQAVIVNVHWNGEYVPELDGQQIDLARRLSRHGVTALVGQSRHVVQPIRRVEGMPVVFGEGNLISDQSAACCPAAAQDGLIALLHVVVRGNRARVARVSYVPTYVRHPGYTVVAVGAAARSGALGRTTARESYRRTVSVAGRGPGIRPVPNRVR